MLTLAERAASIEERLEQQLIKFTLNLQMILHVKTCLR